MYELFFERFKLKVPLSRDEEEQIKSYLTPKKLRKRQYLLQEGDVCKTLAFVQKGLLREYSVDNGTEHIIQFVLEGWTISDLFSFITGEPATYNIDALEDAELVLISKSAHEELLLIQPKCERYMRLLITGAYIALQRRLTSSISMTAEEGYECFIQMYPDIAALFVGRMVTTKRW